MKTNEELMNIAKEASKNAYCPYSKFSVGACLLYENGNVYSGCNVENSSYGLSLCAERNAISTAIASGETSKISKIAIYSPKSAKCYPCGACRQWLQEFEKGQDIQILLEDENGEILEYGINELLPHSFNLI
jgi:cytidine deaminase